MGLTSPGPGLVSPLDLVFEEAFDERCGRRVLTVDDGIAYLADGVAGLGALLGREGLVKLGARLDALLRQSASNDKVTSTQGRASELHE